LVLIGVDMPTDSFQKTLESCLLTDEEMAMGPKKWAALEDPMPAW